MYSKFSFLKFLIASFILCFFVFQAPLAQAESLIQRFSPRMMNGARPLGMGNAFIATKGTDENAMFYNPAAINDYEKKFHFQFVLPTVEFSYKAIPFFATDLPNLADDIDAADTNAEKINVFDNFAAANTGRYEEVSVRGNVAIMMYKWITVALFYDSQGVIALINPVSSTVDIEVESQAGLMLGSAYSFFDDILQAGIAVKFLGRHLIDQTITQRDVITNDTFGDIFNLKQFGFGIGADVGVKITPPTGGSKILETLKPTFAVVVQDIGHTRFFIGDSVGKQKESISIGSAITPKIGPFETIFAFDVRDLEYRGDFLTKFHIGTEWVLPNIGKVLRSFSMRIGVNQAYLAGGIGFDFKYFKINLATYGRDIASRTIQKQSRMFTAQLAAGF